MRVAVVGAGPGALTTAALLSDAGHDVVIANRTATRLAEVMGSTLELFGALEVGPVPVSGAQAISEALDGAQIVIVVVPASGHRDTAESLVGFASPGVPIVVIPGRTGGALEISRILGNGSRHPVVEAQTLPFGCRIAERGKVRIFATKARVPLAGIATQGHTAQVLEVLSVVPGDHPWESSTLTTGLANVGAIIHPAFMLSDGTLQDFARLAAALDEERCALADSYGVNRFTLLEWLGDMYDAPQTDLAEALQYHPIWGRFPKPASMDHRYLTEDIPTGVVPMIDLGEVVDLKMAAFRSALEAANTVLGRDLAANARTLVSLGVEPTREAVLAAFRDG